MKILLCTFFAIPSVGGLWTYMNNLKHGLEQAGHEVDLLGCHPSFTKFYFVKDGASVDIDPLKAELEWMKAQEYPTPWIMDLEIARSCFGKAAKLLLKKDYDVIHAQDVISAREIKVIKPAHVPLITTLHGCILNESTIQGNVQKGSLSSGFLTHFESLGILSSDSVIVPSKWMAGILSRNLHVPVEWLKVIPNGINTAEFRTKMNTPAAILAPFRKKVIFCTARLVKEKGHSYLIEALAKLKNIRTDWECWFVGDGSLAKELEEQAQLLRVKEFIRFIGNRDDVPSLLKEAFLFVLPSITENMPFAIIEAQLAGKASIVSDAGGLPEIVEHGRTGLIFSSGNSDQLFQCIKLLFENDKLRESIERQCRSMSEDKWSLESMVKLIEQQYAKSIKRLAEGGHYENTDHVLFGEVPSRWGSLEIRRES